MTPLATLGLGLLLGLKHALEADHLIAVSTIVTREQSPWRALWIGLWWGAGHTFTLLLTGVVVLGLKTQIPPPLGLSLEFLVGVVLVGLGLTTLYDCWRKRLHAHSHVHADAVYPRAERHIHFHTHAESSAHRHSHLVQVGFKPLLVGMVHGLAGSAALMLLVLTAIPSATLGLLYIMLFGCGSIIGMGLVSFLMGMFVTFASDWLHKIDLRIRVVMGALSTAFGAWMVVEIGVVQGLFVA
jgi:high-affinity nickel permease